MALGNVEWRLTLQHLFRAPHPVLWKSYSVKKQACFASGPAALDLPDDATLDRAAHEFYLWSRTEMISHLRLDVLCAFMGVLGRKTANARASRSSGDNGDCGMVMSLNPAWFSILVLNPGSQLSFSVPT